MKDGAVVGMGGFSIVGIPENGVLAMIEKKVRNLCIVSNIAGIGDWGIGLLLHQGQVSEVNATYVGENPIFEKTYLKGGIRLNVIPQGTLAERCRNTVGGIAASYVRAGVGTYVESGGFTMRLGADGKSIVEVSRPREKRIFNGREYLMEENIHIDYSMIKAWKADKQGNLRFRKTARNFNPDMAGMADITIAEAEEIVDELGPDEIHCPGCFVDRVYKAPIVYKKIERLKYREPPGTSKDKKATKEETKNIRRQKIAARAVKELKDGMYCNLGVGIPVAVANTVMGKVSVDLQGENGLVGMGPYPLKGQEDPDIINAGKETITEAIGHSHSCTSDAFGMMRGQHLHMTMLGSFQVSENADIANWIIPGHKVKGMGGAMDLVTCGSRVVVVMEHTGPGGSPKFLNKCTIPLTGKHCVSVLITDMVILFYCRECLNIMKRMDSF